MEKEKKKKSANGLTKKQLFGYGAGDLGGCCTFALMGSIVTRYYTNILGINTVLLATLLLIWNIWDAVNDPLMGALMDKMFAKHHKKEKFRPWLLRSAPLVCITAIAFWTVPTFFSGVVMVAVLFCCKILYEGTYTMFNIPMGSMLSAMANNDEERAALSSARGVGSMIGNILPAALAPVIIAKFGANDPNGYRIAGSVCAVLGFIFCMLHYYWTEERNVPVSGAEDANNIKFTDILDVFRKNRAFLALCLHGICICTMQYVGSTLGSYMYADVLGNISLMSMASVLAMPILFVILFASPKCAKKFGLENFIRYGLIIGFVLYVGLFIAHLVTDVNPWVHIIWSSLASGCGSISIQMQWGLVGEAIDYNEYLTGKRTEGSIYGTFNLCRRIGQTVGNSAAVLALGWIGYNADAAVQTSGVIFGIKSLCVLLPGVFLLGSWAAFRFVWNITPEIREKMAAMKAAKSQTPAPAADEQ